MHIKITSDSTCDLSQEILDRYDISLARLSVMKGDKEFTDGITIHPADIFAHVASGGELCSTAACSIGQYQTLFASYASTYDAIIHINISSHFSSCYQNACLAAEEYDNVYVIDSMNLSTGQGLVVLKAARLAESGMDAEAIVAQLYALIPKVESSFVLNQLSYMAKGGRCSSATALGANLLNLKPCIEVKDGKMAVVKKYRGSLSKCLGAYMKDRLQGRYDLDLTTLFLTHTPVDGDALDVARKAISEGPVFGEVIETDAGCTVSCHCGPGTLGVLFIRK